MKIEEQHKQRETIGLSEDTREQSGHKISLKTCSRAAVLHLMKCCSIFYH